MDRPFGIYVHVPFCSKRCDYCAFAIWTDREHLMDAYVAACIEELQGAHRRAELRPATSLYIGGGTPSLLGPHRLARLIGAVELVPHAEITVECNPESTTRALLVGLRSAGVRRISMGVQSLNDRVLESLGRAHRPEEVRDAARLVGEVGFESFNVDLIFGAAGERVGDWEASVLGVLALERRPDHVSAYALTVEAGTPLARQPKRHPDEDLQAERYELADELLGEAGLRWYEVSNWAVPAHECRHNRNYWSGGDYRGIGCSAHSHLGGRRFWNIRSVDRYLAAIEHAASPVAGEEQLSDETRALERLVLQLRTSDGVPLEALFDGPGLEGFVERGSGRAVLTRRGRLLADTVSLHLRTPEPALRHKWPVHPRGDPIPSDQMAARTAARL